MRISPDRAGTDRVTPDGRPRSVPGLEDSLQANRKPIMLNRAAIKLTCRPDLLLSPLQNGKAGQYAVKDLRTGDSFTLGEQEYFLLARLDGEQTGATLCQAFEEWFGEPLSEAELQEFVEVAQARGFLQPAEPRNGRAPVASPARVSEKGPAASLPPGPFGAAPSCVVEETEAGPCVRILEPPGDTAAVETSECRYDEVPYSSKPFPQTHPDNLATVATLFGMKPPPVDHCRVLELGCASGGNLIPLAVSLPDSHFIGIDLSRRQIADGLQVVGAVGLRNIELRYLDILDVGADLGQFDYILCHGVYSWVPPAVQDKILEICARNLAPNGVAYVSYNTFPGWHVPSVIRAMMRYHADRFAEPSVRVRQGRALLEFLAQSAPKEHDAYNGALEKELKLLRDVADDYLYHEYLAEVNTPVYFHEFHERAKAKGLQYLGEAAFLDMLAGYFPPEVEKTLHLLGVNLVQTEQYMDFLRNRRFRQTLLCHRGVPLNRSLNLECLEQMYVASAFQPRSAQPDLHSSAVEEFRTSRGFSTSSSEPLVKAALLHLAEVSPAAVPFRDLPAAAQARLGRVPVHSSTANALTRSLLGCLLKCAAPNVLEFSVNPSRFVMEISQRPTTTPLARFQAAAGTAVANLCHRVVTLNAIDRQVLRHLDGSRDRAQLTRLVANCLDRDMLTTMPEWDEHPLEARTAQGLLEELLNRSLARLAQHALLAG